MANLKRNSIELFKEVKDDEVVTEKFWTPPFLSLKVVYEAADLMAKYEKVDEDNKELTSLEVKTSLEEMCEFVANRVYAGQFTKEDLDERYHGPGAYHDMQSQIMFVAWGVQNDDTKKFLAKKKN